MMGRARTGAFCALLALLSACEQQPAVVVDNGWIRKPPAGRSMCAGYLELRFRDTQVPHELVGVRSSEFERIEIHETRETDGVARMRRIDSVVSDEDGSIVLAPGAKHLMLMVPTRDIAQMEEIEVELLFAADPPLRTTLSMRDTAPE